MGDCFSLPCFPGTQSDEPKTVNIFLGFFFMLNMVVGIGFLGLPFSLVSGGILPGIITIVVAAFVGWNCAIWELEVMARAQAYIDFKSSNERNMNEEYIPNFRIDISRKFEPCELCQLFVGTWFKIVYIIALIITLFLASIAYGTVAGSAWSVNIPFNFSGLEQCTQNDFSGILPSYGPCRNAYWLCLAIFGGIVVPLSFIELKDQLIVQVFMGILRFVAISSIVIYCVVNLGVYQNICTCEEPWQSSNASDMEHCNMTESIGDLFKKFDGKSWSVAVPVIVFALIFHQSIPSLTHPILQKKYLRAYFSVLYIVLFTIYTTLGLTVAMWFRTCTSGTCTLNWSAYIKFDNTALKVLSYFLILFPSLDIISVYPLVVLTLVNNIYTVIFGKDTSQMPKTRRNTLIRLGMTLITALLPIFIAMGVSNLVVVLNYAGLFGFLICYFAPILLQLRSQWVCVREFQEKPENTEDTGKFALITEAEQAIEVDDTTPLISTTHISEKLKDFFSFLFQDYFNEMRIYRNLYMTPYSTFLSYWPAVWIIGSVGVLLFLITVVSLFAPLF